MKKEEKEDEFLCSKYTGRHIICISMLNMCEKYSPCNLVPEKKWEKYYFR
jgi:hypothetical protein